MSKPKQTRSRRSSTVSRIVQSVFVLGLVAGVAFLTTRDSGEKDRERGTSQSSGEMLAGAGGPGSGGPPRLVKSPDVVQAKVDRKTRKLESAKARGQAPVASRSGAEKKSDKAIARRRREEERYLARLNEDGTAPVSARVRAKRHAERMPPLPRDSGVGQWEWLGPGNVGGRIRAILTDPNDIDHLFIGSVSGGIWESTNAGASWAPVNDFMANLNVTHMIRDSVDPDIIYASTGEGFVHGPPGDGIFKSTDGGDTWNQLPSTDNSTFRWVTRLAAHPGNAGHLYATTSIGINTVHESTDYGASWQQIFWDDDLVTDIKVHPNEPDYILVGTGEGGHRSTDGGATWSNLSVGGGNALPDSTGRVEFAWGSDEWAYASVDANFGEIWQSTDYGATWTLRNTGNDYLSEQGWYDNVIWVDPFDSQWIAVGGIDLWRSNDGGATLNKISTWTQYHTGLSAHADQHAIVPAIDYNSLPNHKVYVGNDGGIQTCNIWSASLISGWTNLANGLGITQFYHGAAAPDGSIFVGGAQDNDNIRYREGDGTGGWYQAETGDGGFCAVDFDDPDILYTEYVYLELEKSTDGGDSYFGINAQITDAGSRETALFIAPFAMHTSNPDILYAGGINLWKTLDGGANWIKIRATGLDSVKASAVAVAPSTGGEVWFGYADGRVSRSSNGGVGWFDVDQNGLPNRWVTDIAIHPANPSEAIVAMGGTFDNLWRTTDSGGSWTRITGSGATALPPIQINTVTFHPTQTDWFYVGTDIGVFASADEGQTWNTMPQYEGNDGPANVEIGELFWYGDRLGAATFGRGMFATRPLETVYVDGAYLGLEEGTFAQPFDTVGEGEAFRGSDATLSIEAGEYIEGYLRLEKRGTVQATGGTVTIR